MIQVNFKYGVSKFSIVFHSFFGIFSSHCSSCQAGKEAPLLQALTASCNVPRPTLDVCDGQGVSPGATWSSRISGLLHQLLQQLADGRCSWWSSWIVDEGGATALLPEDAWKLDGGRRDTRKVGRWLKWPQICRFRESCTYSDTKRQKNEHMHRCNSSRVCTNFLGSHPATVVECRNMTQSPAADPLLLGQLF